MLNRDHETAVLVSPIAGALPDLSDCDWIGVDGGWVRIVESSHPLHAIIGDFDSSSDPGLDASIPVERYPVRKDETDAELAMKLAVESGYTKIVFWGALGGRLDHTLANLRCMVWKYPQVVCMDDQHRVRVLLPGSHIIEKKYRHVSFFACDPCRITLIGFDYPLSRAPLDQRDFYTCSNSIREQDGKVIIERGRVLCVESDIE